MAAVANPFTVVSTTVAPAPSALLASNLTTLPVATNAAWENYVLNNGDQPEYMHPYQLRSSSGALSIGYPTRTATATSVLQAFVADLVVSAATGGTHTLIAYDDLTLTLRLPGPMLVPIARGSPYVTVNVLGGILSITTQHAVLNVSSNSAKTKHRVSLNNGQLWLFYTDQPLDLGATLSVAQPFAGVLRIALLSDATTSATADSAAMEAVLDQFSNVYAVQGSATLLAPNKVRYSWTTQSWTPSAGVNTQLLMLSHSVHRQLLQLPNWRNQVTYGSVDGPLVGVVGHSWLLQEKAPVPVLWHSYGRIQNASGVADIQAALQKDVAGLTPINTTASYFFGKAVARVARLALIAEQVQLPDVLPTLTSFLRTALTPWLDGTQPGNGFLYDSRYGGIVTKNGAADKGADFGVGVYNDHHFHYGYFAYASAVLGKFDKEWLQTYSACIKALVHDYALPDEDAPNAAYPRFRHFDWWKLHSWASGLTEFGDGRNQESAGEALNSYYGAALLGRVLKDAALEQAATTVLSLEMRSAKALWLVPSNGSVYDSAFVAANRVMGIVWANKRDSNLWWAPADWRECRTGIQMIPLLPLTEKLLADKAYVTELVAWTRPALSRPGVLDGWRGFFYALQAVVDPNAALAGVRALTSHDDGNSLSNLLWWIYSRPV